MRFISFTFLIFWLAITANAEPRPYYPKFEDPELQSCMQELAEHLTKNVSYNAQDVLKDDGSSVIIGCVGSCNARGWYNAIREANKATDRLFLGMGSKMKADMTVAKIKNLREGFEFNTLETMQHVTEICSFTILEDKKWQILLR